MGRRFYIVWLGQLVSGIGSALTAFGAAFWVYAETGDSEAWLALMFGAATVPRVAVTPVLGIVDRYDRRAIMIAADTAAVLITVTVIAIWLADGLQPWHLLMSTVVGALFAALQRPAYSAGLPTLVDPDDLDRANGLLQLGPALEIVIAPGLAAALVAWVGIGSVFAVDLVTFIVGIATVAAIRFGTSADTDPGDDETSYRLSTAASWLLANRRPLVVLTAVLALMNVALAGVGIAMVARAEELAGAAATGLGPTAGGLGMIIASLIVGARGTPKRRRVPAVGAAIAGFGVMLATSVAVASLLLFVVCVGLGISVMPFVSATLRTLFQQWIPDQMLGRSFGILGAVTTAAEPIGLAIAVPVVGWSAAGAMALAGAAVVLLGCVVATAPLFRPLNDPPP